MTCQKAIVVAIVMFNKMKHVEKLLHIAIGHVHQIWFGKTIWPSSRTWFELVHGFAPGWHIKRWQLKLTLWKVSLCEQHNPPPLFF